MGRRQPVPDKRGSIQILGDRPARAPDVNVRAERAKPYGLNLLTYHLGATLRALLLITRLPDDVRLPMPAVGANAVADRLGGLGATHPVRPAPAATASATTTAATAATTTSTTLTHFTHLLL